MNEKQHHEPVYGGGQATKAKITLLFVDGHAPGIVGFLGSLPARTETAFIRGLIYQWMLENQGADDYDQRLLAVLNGPGGRSTFGLPGAVAQSFAPRLNQPRPAARRRAQTVMPEGDAPRHQVTHAAARKDEPIAVPAPRPPASPAVQPKPVVVAPAPVPQAVAPTPVPASALIASPEPSQPDAHSDALVDEVLEMNPFDNFDNF